MAADSGAAPAQVAAEQHGDEVEVRAVRDGGPDDSVVGAACAGAVAGQA